MKAQSKTIGMAIGVVLIIAIFTGVVLSSRGQAISSEISGNSEGGAALSLANTEDTEIIIKTRLGNSRNQASLLWAPTTTMNTQKKSFLITMGLNLIFQVFSPT